MPDGVDQSSQRENETEDAHQAHRLHNARDPHDPPGAHDHATVPSIFSGGSGTQNEPAGTYLVFLGGPFGPVLHIAEAGFCSVNGGY